MDRKFPIKPELIFLIDGIGALLSTFLLGWVLVRFEDIFGIPRVVLYPLSAGALGLAVYSFSCHFFVKRKLPVFLLIIALANLLYVNVSLIVVGVHYSKMPFWGISYFGAELAVLILLITIEIKVFKKTSIN